MMGSASLSVTSATSAGKPISAHHGGGASSRAFALLLPFPSCTNQKVAQSLQLGSMGFTGRTSRRSTSCFKTAVASVDSDQLSSSPNSPEKQDNKYYFVVANAKFMLDEEEHFKELLFERLRYYGEREKEQDFWLVIEPKFLDKFPNITKRLSRPAVALVSTNSTWITFMKLRLDRVLSDSYEAESLEEALASNPTTIEFEKPKNWVAPYPKYEYGWWDTLLPKETKESQV
ncbi:hypothetical protein Ddye_019866 [Dipteronia dyeriana]|uniref:Ycf54 n=1 Tax=Dipteronia dyeriana TaxID=168575 RepID=A0AAD9WVG9_9ROSI|nr:hypothetical protein Ddye_019866 [Dipteronia dyeriana]